MPCGGAGAEGRCATMVSLLCRGVGVLVKSLAGFSSTQPTRCSGLSGALAAVQCTTTRCFSKDITLHDLPSASTPKEPPKRPLSSFLRFSSEQRPLVIRRNPEASFIEIGKIIGRNWRVLPEAEKQVYEEAARYDNLIYREQYRKYKASLNPRDLEILSNARKQKRQRKKVIRRRKELTSHGIPKRCRSSFNIFMSAHFHETKGNSLSERMKKVVHEWKILPLSKKQVYVQLAQDDKVRYENEIKAWEEQMIEIGRVDLVRHRHKPRHSKNNLAGVDKKPAKEKKIKKATEPAKKKKTKKDSEPAKEKKKGPEQPEE